MNKVHTKSSVFDSLFTESFEKVLTRFGEEEAEVIRLQKEYIKERGLMHYNLTASHIDPYVRSLTIMTKVDRMVELLHFIILTEVNLQTNIYCCW